MNTDYYIGTKESVKSMHSENGITYQETERHSVGAVQLHLVAFYHESTKGFFFVFQISESRDVYWSDRVVFIKQICCLLPLHMRSSKIWFHI